VQEEQSVEQIRQLKAAWQAEMQSLRQAWAAAEKSKRDAWMADKMREVKELTVKVCS
jgi:5-azacytidine-induced protein 1